MNFFIRKSDVTQGVHPQVTEPLAHAPEPRIIFDDAAVEAVDNNDSNAADSDGRQVVVVDASVEDYQKLLDAIAPEADLILIQGDQDGFDALADQLSGYENVDSLHIISHGSNGKVVLGDSVLSQDSLAQYANQLNAIGAAMSETGDILIYSCDVAGDVTGVQFVNDLALATGADVAASNDATGASNLGGDWDLEITTGDIETDAPFSEAALASFDHVLQETESFETGWLGPDGLNQDSISGTIDGVTFEIFGINTSGDVSADAGVGRYGTAYVTGGGSNSLQLQDHNGNAGDTVSFVIQRQGGTDSFTLTSLHAFAYSGGGNLTFTPYLDNVKQDGNGGTTDGIETVTEGLKRTITWSDMLVDKLVITSDSANNNFSGGVIGGCSSKLRC